MASPSSTVDSTLLAVLDTNVWLDWLVFDDPSCRALAGSVAEGRVRISASAAMRAEFAHVIARDTLALDGRRQTDCLQRFDALCGPWPHDDSALGIVGGRAPGAGGSAAAAVPALLRCTDPDDQMFIDWAVARSARWLLSRDKALLALARRAARLRPLWIGRPVDWSLAGSGVRA